jgi:hypothetical protein
MLSLTALAAVAPAQEPAHGRRTAELLEPGLAWLAEHQDEEGYWDADACEGGASTTQDVGVTALALLAFMGDGHALREGEYEDVVTRAVQWLRDQQDAETGLIGASIGHTFIYDHGIATLAMCKAYDSSKSPLLEATAQRGVNYILRARNPYGAWRYDVPPVGDNDTAVTSWMVQALLAARDAGLRIDPQALEDALRWLDAVTDPATGRVGYDSMGSTSSRIIGVNDHFPPEAGEGMTAAALYLRALLGETERTNPLLRMHAELLLRCLPAHEPDAHRCDFYYWYYGSQAMHQAGGRAWELWRGALLDALERGQAGDGSWDPVGAWGAIGGRVMTTALACLSLEAPLLSARGGAALEAQPEAFAGAPPAQHAPRAGRAPTKEPATRQQIAAGLRWLARHQSESGHWDVDRFMLENHGAPTECDGPGIATQDVGVTGLALLAFLRDGNTLLSGPHQQVVLRAVNWLRRQQQPDTGLIGERLGHTFHYDHAIATLALCTAYGQTRSPLIRKNAQLALDYIARARNPYGVWRYDMPPAGDNDTSVTSWMVQALVAGKEARLRIDPAALRDSIAWLDAVTDEQTGRVGYDSKGSRSARVVGVNDAYPVDRAEALTGAGLLCRFLLGQDPSSHPIMEAHARLLRERLPAFDSGGEGCDMYAWYHGSYAMNAMGGRHAEAWRSALLEAASAGDRVDGDHRGSWDPIGPWGAWGGRVYATAMMTLCLEAPFGLGASTPEEGVADAQEIEDELEEEPIIQDFEVSDHDEAADPVEPAVDAATGDALARSLRWLARNQQADGSWGLGDGDELIHQEGVTALAVLALMRSGSSIRAGEWRDQITQAVEWLVARQGDSGRVGKQEGHSFLYEHGIATLVLVEAYRGTKSPLLKAPAQRAVSYALAARNPYGAWRYSVPPTGDNDTSVTGWMVYALARARDAGLRVPDEAFAGALSWLDEVSDPATGRAGYDSQGSRSSRTIGKNDSYPPERGEAMTAVALHCRYLLGQKPESEPIMGKHVELLLKLLPEWDPQGLGVDMYYWYFGTRAMQQHGGASWRAWRESLRATLLDVQRADGQLAGSFDPIGPWGYAGGRAYATALMALCLEASMHER